MLENLLSIENPRLFIADLRKTWLDHSIFRGIGFTKDEVILGESGWLDAESAIGIEPEDLISGRFLGVFVKNQIATAYCDPLVQDTLYYWPCPDGRGAVISNSFMNLARYLSREGIHLDIYTPALRGFLLFSGGGIGAQLFQEKTPINGVFMLPRGHFLRIERRAGGNRVTLEKRPAPSGLEIRPALESFVKNSIRRLRAIAELPDAEMQCDLSGGRDSRLVFGMLSRSGISPEAVRLHSQKSKPEEYAIAQEVASRFGYSLGGPAVNRGQRIDSLLKVNNWIFGSAGVYIPFYFGGGTFESNKFHLHGGNFVATQFARHSPRNQAERIKRSLKFRNVPADDVEALISGFLDYFEKLDLDPDSNISMQKHYIDFRSRFHYGRNWAAGSGTSILTPLIDHELFQIYHEQGRDVSNFYTDLFLSLDKRLLSVPFDLEYKNLSPAAMEDSEFSRHPLQIRHEELDSMRVFGDLPSFQEFKFETVELPETYRKAGVRAVLSTLLSDVRESVLDRGIFAPDLVKTADDQFLKAKKLSHDVRLSAAILQAGIIAKIAG